MQRPSSRSTLGSRTGRLPDHWQRLDSHSCLQRRQARRSQTVATFNMQLSTGVYGRRSPGSRERTFRSRELTAVERLGPVAHRGFDALGNGKKLEAMPPVSDRRILRVLARKGAADYLVSVGVHDAARCAEWLSGPGRLVPGPSQTCMWIVEHLLCGANAANRSQRACRIITLGELMRRMHVPYVITDAGAPPLSVAVEECTLRLAVWRRPDSPYTDHGDLL